MSDTTDTSLPQAAIRHPVGYFRYYVGDRRWEWSDEAARIHGYKPGEVEPTTELLLSHKHPDDRSAVADILSGVINDGIPFSSWHRIIARDGNTRQVLVVGDRLFDDEGTQIGAEGYYVDLTESREIQAEITGALSEISIHRSVVDQAKGMLMFVYGIDAQRAFDVLTWRSQTTNTKLRDLAANLIRITTTSALAPSQVRQAFDHLLLTAHLPDSLN